MNTDDRGPQKPCENCDSTGTLRGLTDEGGNRLPCPICNGQGPQNPTAEAGLVAEVLAFAEHYGGVPKRELLAIVAKYSKGEK